jgi:predicted TPR repeat methyltransferase
MLARARARGIYDRLELADVAATGLDGAVYDLVTTCLVDEHLADLRPLYREVSRLAVRRLARASAFTRISSCAPGWRLTSIAGLASRSRSRRTSTS